MSPKEARIAIETIRESGPWQKEDVIALDRMRRKRHATIYDTAGTISIREAENAVERAEKLVQGVERMLKGD